MTKQQAINLFGGNMTHLAKQVGRGKSAVSQWPEILSNDISALVIGSAVKKGIKIPKEMLE